MSGFENDVMVAKNLNFNEAGAKPHLGIINAAGLIPIGTGNVQPLQEIEAGTVVGGPGVSVTYVSPNLVVTANGANDLHVATYIVNPNGPANGTGSNYQTIAAAITAVQASLSNGTIFLMPGTYTENITLTTGINLAAFDCDATTPNVTINGKVSMATAGTCSISGINLQTNSDYLLEVTTSGKSVINLNNCYLNSSNHSGIHFTSNNSGSQINVLNCNGDIGTTGISLFTMTSTGALQIKNTRITNTGGSSTASTNSAGTLTYSFCDFLFPTTLSSTGTLGMGYTSIDTSAQNVIALTLGGGTQTIKASSLSSGTASASTMSTTGQFEGCFINSSNTNALTGAGTLKYSALSFEGTSLGVNVTTQTIIPFGANVPSFSACLSANQTNKTGAGAVYTVLCDTVTYDVMSNYVAGTGTFTAPYTGKYQFNFKVYVTACTIASSCSVSVVTTARSYTNQFFRAAGAQDFGVEVSCIADMTAADTATFTVSCFGEAGSTDTILGNNAYSSTWVQGRYLGPK